MMFLTSLSLLVITIFTGCKSLSDIPKISVYPCEVPVADKLFSICCKTENIYTSSVFFFQNTTDNIIAKIDHPCYVTTGRGLISWNCQTSGHIRTFRINTTRNTSHSTGLWGCEYYGGRSSFNLTENKIVTRNSGNHFAKLHDNTTLTWMIRHRDYKIYMPDGQLLNTSELKHSIESNITTVSVTLFNISEKANGTYICVSDQNKMRDAITLIVVEPPLRPSILALTTEFSGHIMTLNLTCQTNSLSAGPPYYVPQFNISWLYSTTAGYKVIPDGHFLIIKDFDCNLKYSRPVFCALKESPGDWTPSAFTYPHKQCVSRPNVVTQQDSKTDKSAQTAGYVIAGISSNLTMVTNLIRQYVPDDAPVPTDPIFISTRGMVGPSTQPTAAKQTVALPSNILERRPLVENEPPTKITKKATNCPVKNPVTRTATVTRPVVENNTTHLPINATNTVSLSASSDEGTTPTVGAEASSRYDWGERETRFLIQLITDNWKKLELAYNKKPIWLDISVKLNETMATKLTQDQCREKWNTLKKTYKSYKRQCSLTGNRKPRPFLFESDLDDLMLNDPSITPVLTMGSNTGVIDGEDITTNNTTERESTSSANKSTKKSCKRAKKSDVEDLKEYFEERDKKFMNTLEKMFEKNTEVMEKLVDKL